MKIILTVKSQTNLSHLHFSTIHVIVIQPSQKLMNFFRKLYEFEEYFLKLDRYLLQHYELSLLDFDGSLAMMSEVKILFDELFVAIQFPTRLMKVKETSLIRIKVTGITSFEHSSGQGSEESDCAELFQAYHLFVSRQSPFHLG